MTAKTLEVIDPSRKHVITEVLMHSEKEANEKIAKAFDNASLKPAKIPQCRRKELLDLLASQLEELSDEFATIISTESGKPIADSRIEVTRTVNEIKAASYLLSRQQLHGGDCGNFHLMCQGFLPESMCRSGVLVAFSAFTHPLNLVVHQIIPAFIAGYPCIIKPSPDTPLSCMRLINLMHDIGIPAECIDYVIATDFVVSETLVKSNKVGFFSYAGAECLGWKLRSKTNLGVRCALAYGDIAPCIVTESADLGRAIPSIAKGAFYHGGQSCTSTQHVFVEEGIMNDFKYALLDHVEGLLVGDALCECTQVGPLIRTGEVSRVQEWVNEAIDLGGELICGGKSIGGNYYKPTVLFSPPVEARVSGRGVFGPVLSLYPYSDLKTVLNKSSIRPSKMQISIFTGDIGEAHKIFDLLDASAMFVNNHSVFQNDMLPLFEFSE